MFGDFDKAEAFEQQRAGFGVHVVDAIARYDDDAGDARVADAWWRFELHGWPREFFESMKGWIASLRSR
ncbi:MAG TPA: hypothetical protein VKV96_00180 [Roseiarcus sp.]|nr:hypothetical protein [Roseiarcus sp.]